jgi:hypothetical protein
MADRGVCASDFARHGKTERDEKAALLSKEATATAEFGSRRSK